MSDTLLFLLLVVAIGIGYGLGRWSRRIKPLHIKPGGVKALPLDSEYIRGLNYLLNDETDAAVDTLTQVLPVTSQTLETHLALGALLRRRGEVGRAIRVHQNLVARPSLGKLEQQRAQLELARDYVQAGVLDRAENLLQELVETAEHSVRVVCLEHLAEIYRDEREWEKAIHTVDLLSGRRFAKLPPKWRVIQSHFCCELAEEALERSDYLSVRRRLKQALEYDRDSVRASILLGELEYRLGHYREALKALKRIPEQDPDYIPEGLPLLVSSYERTGRLAELSKYLDQLMAEYPSSSLMMLIAEQVRQAQGESAAVSYMGGQLALRPSLKGVGKFLDFHWRYKESSGADADGKSAAIRLLVDALIESKASYSCHSCGFSGNQLHWLCPSCKSWGSVKPVKGVEGE